MSAFLGFSEPASQTLAWVLVHFLWQGTVCALLLAFVIGLPALRNVRLRYALSFMTLLAMAACPFLTFVVLAGSPAWPVVVSQSSGEIHFQKLVAGPVSPHEERQTTVWEPSESPLVPQVVSRPPVFQPVLNMPDMTVSEDRVAKRGTDAAALQVKPLSWQPWVVRVWFFGVVLFSIRLLAGWVGVHQIRRDVIAAPEQLVFRTRLLAEALRCGLPCLRLSRRVTEALAIGFLKPLIILPVSWVAELSPDMLEAVIVHELAHIRRGDLWFNLLQCLIETLLFYHPAIWWVSRRIRIERELCCDECVVGLTDNRLRYAETLEHIGRLSLGQASPALAISVRSSRLVLLARVRYVLGMERRKSNLNAWIAGLVPVLAATAIWYSTVAVPPTQASDSGRAIVTESNEGRASDRTLEASDNSETTAPSVHAGLASTGPKTPASTEVPQGSNATQSADAEDKTATGNLVYPDGRPAAGISVMAFEGANLLPQKFVTDAQGHVSVPADWMQTNHFLCLVAYDRLHGIGWHDFFLHARSPNAPKPAQGAFQFVLLPVTRSVRGQILDERDTPLEGITISVEYLDHDQNFGSTHWDRRTLDGKLVLPAVRTDANGWFELKLPAQAGVQVRATHPDWTSQRISVARKSENVPAVKLARAGKVTGQVTWRGQPVEGIKIGAQAVKPDVRHGGWGEAVTDEEGKYEIGGLPEGPFNVLILDGGPKFLTAAALDSLQIAPGKVHTHDFALMIGRRLRGRVIEQASGKNLPGCTVGCYGPARPKSGAAIQSVITDANGEFSFYVPPGLHHVYIAELREPTGRGQLDVVVPAEGDAEFMTLTAGAVSEKQVRVFIGPAADRKVSLNAKRMPLQEALESVCRDAGVRLSIDGDGLKAVGYTRNMPVHVELSEVRLADALARIIAPFEQMAFEINGNDARVTSKKKLAPEQEMGALQSPEILEGVVRDRLTLQPISDAEVLLCRLEKTEFRNSIAEIVAAGKTDGAGKYSLRFTDATRSQWRHDSEAVVWAMGPGYAPGVVQVARGKTIIPENNFTPQSKRAVDNGLTDSDIGDADQDDDKIFGLDREQDVAVEIHDVQGNLVSGTVQQLELSAGPVPDAFRKQMIEGGFAGKLVLKHMPRTHPEVSPVIRVLRIDSPSHGRQEFTWNADSTSRREGRIQEGNEPVKLTALSLGTVSGRLVVENGELPAQSVMNRRLSLQTFAGDSTLKTPWARAFTETQIDAEGRFQLKNVPCGRLVDVRLDLPAAVPWRVLPPHGSDQLELKAGQDNSVDVPLVATREVRGIVRRASKTGISGVRLLVSHGALKIEKLSETATSMRAAYRDPITSDATGRFSFHVVPGEIQVSKFLGNTDMTTSDLWPGLKDFPARQPGNLLKIEPGNEHFELPPIELMTYRGKLLDETGNPIKAQLIGYSDRNQAALGMIESGPDGQFSLETLGKVRHWAAVRGPQDAGDFGLPGKQAPDVVVQSEFPLVLRLKTKTQQVGEPANQQSNSAEPIQRIPMPVPSFPTGSGGGSSKSKVTGVSPLTDTQAENATVQAPAEVKLITLEAFESTLGNQAFDLHRMEAVRLPGSSPLETLLTLDRFWRDCGCGDLLWLGTPSQLVGYRQARLIRLDVASLEEARKLSLGQLETQFSERGQPLLKLAPGESGCLAVQTENKLVALLEIVKVSKTQLQVKLEHKSDVAASRERPESEIESAAWGPIVNGLQAGLAFRQTENANQARNFAIGDLVQVKLFVRNTGDQERSLSWRTWQPPDRLQIELPLLDDWQPQLTRLDGQSIVMGRKKPYDSGLRRQTRIQPGQSVLIGVTSLSLWSSLEPGFGVYPQRNYSVVAAPGGYRLATRVPTGLIEGIELKTGELKFTVVAPLPEQELRWRTLDSVGHSADRWGDTGANWKNQSTGNTIRPVLSAQASELQTIRGRAIDAETGVPVAGAEARVEICAWGDQSCDDLLQYQTTTDGEGRFEVHIPRPLLNGYPNPQQADFRVFVTHPRYSEKFLSSRLNDLRTRGLVSPDGTIRPAPDVSKPETEIKSDQLADVQLAVLKPARIVSGRLLNAAGQPLGDVHLYGGNAQGWPVLSGLPVTDADGRFRVNVPAQMTMKLEFRAVGLGRTYVTVTPDQTALGDIRVGTGKVVRGRILDAGGVPLAHVSVTTPALPDRNSQPNFIYETDKDGWFKTDLLPPGEYQVEVGSLKDPANRNQPSLSGPPPDLYLPQRFVVRPDQPVPDLVLRPASSVRFTALLQTSVLKPVGGQKIQAIDPLAWRIIQDQARREREKNQPKKPAGIIPAGKLELTFDDSTGNAVLAGNPKDQQEFALNWINTFALLPSVNVRGKLENQDWTRTPNVLELAQEHNPSAYSVKLPRDLTDIEVDGGDYIQHYELKSGQRLFGKSIHLNRFAEDRFDIKLLRYLPTTLRVGFVDASGKPIDLPQNQLLEGITVQSRYVRETEVKAAGARFESSESLMKRAVFENTVNHFVLPGEPIELTVAAKVGTPVTQRISLKDGETRFIQIELGPEQKWTEKSERTLEREQHP